MPDRRFSEDRNRRVVANFGGLGKKYDSIRHVRAPAHRIVERAAPQLGAQVLDVASGTGWTAMAAAECVGATGWASTVSGMSVVYDKEGIDPGQCPFDHDTNLASFCYT